MDATQIGNAIVHLAQDQGEGLFLLARVVTTQLRREPSNTSAPEWERQLAHSVQDAFARDLDRIPPRPKDDHDVPQAARELLSALAWGYGAGLPDDVWPIIATALSPTPIRYSRDDVLRKTMTSSPPTCTPSAEPVAPKILKRSIHAGAVGTALCRAGS
jgi:hypothetical protein